MESGDLYLSTLQQICDFLAVGHHLIVWGSGKEGTIKLALQISNADNKLQTIQYIKKIAWNLLKTSE